MSTSLLNPEQTAALNRARQANARPRPPSVPEIKLCQNPMDGVEPGEYYTKEYDSDTEKNVIKSIGPMPKVIVLYRAYSYSWFDETDNELKAWTNEFSGFSNTDQTYLFAKKDGKAVVEFSGVYPELKKHISANYCFKKGARVESLMKFRNVLYVVYDGKVFRMIVSNASAAGVPVTMTVDKDGKEVLTYGAPDFKNPQPGSFIEFTETVVHSDENAFHGHFCDLGSNKMTPPNKPVYYIMTFRDSGPVDDIAEATNRFMKLLVDLDMLLRSNLERMQMPEEKKDGFDDVIDA